MNPSLNFSRLILPLALLAPASAVYAQSAPAATAPAQPAPVRTARPARAAETRPAESAHKPAQPVQPAQAVAPTPQAAPSPHHSAEPAAEAVQPTREPAERFTGMGDGVKTCPVSGDPVDPKLSIVLNGRKIHVCCEECMEAIKQHPARYLTSRTGEPVEAAPAAAASAPDAAAGHCAEPASNANALIPQDAAACPAAAPAAQAAPAAAH